VLLTKSIIAATIFCFYANFQSVDYLFTEQIQLITRIKQIR